MAMSRNPHNLDGSTSDDRDNSDPMALVRYRESQLERQLKKIMIDFGKATSLVLFFVVLFYWLEGDATHCDNKMHQLSNEWDNDSCGNVTTKALGSFCDDYGDEDGGGFRRALASKDSCDDLGSTSDLSSTLLSICVSLCEKYCKKSESQNLDEMMLFLLGIAVGAASIACLFHGANLAYVTYKYYEECQLNRPSELREVKRGNNQEEIYNTFGHPDEDRGPEEANDQGWMAFFYVQLTNWAASFSESMREIRVSFDFFGRSDAVSKGDEIEMEPLLSQENGRDGKGQGMFIDL
ncbi:MAG: hypothetical protein ACE365_04795 [Gammaproteobacteria bacterium]